MSGRAHDPGRFASLRQLSTELARGGVPGAWLQDLAPRTRVLGAILLLLAALVARDAGVLVGIYLLCCAGALLGRFDLGRYLQANLLLAGVFVAPVALLGALSWFVPGDPVWRMGPVIFTDRGLRQAGLLFLRALDAVAVTTLVVRSLGTRGTVDGMRALGLPDSVAAVLHMALGHIALLARTAGDMMLSLQARTITPMGLSTAYRAVAAHGVVLLQKSLVASRETHGAMLARGFTGSFPRARVSENRWEIADLATLAVLAVVLILALALR